MNRDMLGRSLGRFESISEERYEPGSHWNEWADFLLGKYVEEFEELRTLEWEDREAFRIRLRENADQFLEHIQADRDFCPQPILDGLLQGAGQLETHVKRRKLSWVLDPLVQAMYEAGYNDFLIDFTPVDDWVQIFGSYLKGEEENPLKVTCRTLSHVDYLGSFAQHCHITLLGKVTVVGRYSERCEYTTPGCTDVSPPVRTHP